MGTWRRAAVAIEGQVQSFPREDNPRIEGRKVGASGWEAARKCAAEEKNTKSTTQITQMEMTEPICWVWIWLRLLNMFTGGEITIGLTALPTVGSYQLIRVSAVTAGAILPIPIEIPWIWTFLIWIIRIWCPTWTSSSSPLRFRFWAEQGIAEINLVPFSRYLHRCSPKPCRISQELMAFTTTPFRVSD